jgi:hypothetical protein
MNSPVRAMVPSCARQEEAQLGSHSHTVFIPDTSKHHTTAVRIIMFSMISADRPCFGTCFLQHLLNVSCSLPRGHSTGSQQPIFAARLCNSSHYERKSTSPPHQNPHPSAPNSRANLSKSAEAFRGLTLPVPTHMDHHNEPPSKRSEEGTSLPKTS